MNETNMKIASVLRFLPDKVYLNFRFFKSFHRFINWKTPTTYNEKLQWLKIYCRRPEYITMVDKAEAKKYVAERIGEEYIIPTIGVWDSFDDIDFNLLPEKFVLKCTHDSGGLVVCKNKSELDIQDARNRLTKSLHTNYFWFGREWPYKMVKPRIIAEQYMEDMTDKELRDYKFFCFHGVPKVLFIATDRGNDQEDTKSDFFDMDFNHLDIRNGHPNALVPPHKPLAFDKMKKLAAELSKDIPHLRVDFYEVNGKIYFGELTLSHWSGFMPFEPDEWDERFGSWIDLGRL